MTTKKQRIKRLIKHLIFKIFTFAIILGGISYFVNLPIFANQLAMGQLDRDDISYVFWSIYVVVKSFFNSYYDLFICIFAGTIIYDIYTFIKINKGENKYEN